MLWPSSRRCPTEASSWAAASLWRRGPRTRWRWRCGAPPGTPTACCCCQRKDRDGVSSPKHLILVNPPPPKKTTWPPVYEIGGKNDRSQSQVCFCNNERFQQRRGDAPPPPPPLCLMSCRVTWRENKEALPESGGRSGSRRCAFINIFHLFGQNQHICPGAASC